LAWIMILIVFEAWLCLPHGSCLRQFLSAGLCSLLFHDLVNSPAGPCSWAGFFWIYILTNFHEENSSLNPTYVSIESGTALRLLHSSSHVYCLMFEVPFVSGMFQDIGWSF